MHGMSDLLDQLRFYLAANPAAARAIVVAVLGLAAALGLTVSEETEAAITALVLAAVGAGGMAQVHNRATPTMEKLPDEVLERLEAKWQARWREDFDGEEGTS